MFRLLDRYIIREILPYFFIGFFLLTAIIFVHEANRFSELFVIFSRRGVSSLPLLLLVLSLLPSIMIFTLPISFLLAVMMAMGRLSGDSEIIVMRAGGVGPLRLLRPTLAVGLVVMAITAYNTFYWLPISVNSLNQLKKTRSDVLLRGIETQIRPGVFTEDLPGKVLFIERTVEFGAWERIFIAEDAPDKANEEPKIYTAEAGQLILGKTLQETELRLSKSRFYDTEPRQWDAQRSYGLTYSGSSFIGFSLGGKSDDANPDLKPEAAGPDLMTMPELLAARPPADKGKAFLIEINKRIALPVSCLIFALLGVALGVTTLRSGKSSGLFVGTLITLAYYLLFIGGEQAARSGAAPLWAALWGPNILFGILSAWMFAGGPSALTASAAWKSFWRRWRLVADPVFRTVRAALRVVGVAAPRAKSEASAARVSGFTFPRIIDQMIAREAVRYFFLILLGLCGIFHVFTVFSLINGIVQNAIGPEVVASYLFFLTPHTLNYMTPFAALIAVLVTFGLFGKTSQLIVLNSSGQSLYRLALPVLLGATMLSGLMLASQEYVLPSANRRQDYLRYQIKGGKLPPQTFYQSNRKWFRGKENRLFNFANFNPEKDEFFGLGIYEVNPDTAGLASRTYVKNARWDKASNEWILTGGWRRTFSLDGNSSTTTQIAEERLRLPEGPDYFKQGVPEIAKMSIGQLQRQIDELRPQGVDVEDLARAVQVKIASPLACLVMALVGLPFALTVGKRGAMVGTSVGVVIAIVFWGTIGLFEQLGNQQLLPSFWSAWGPNMLFSAAGIYFLFTAKT
jgi:LPS export ABC transporter permease LptF/LPS export ABC transporter permease LptG